MRKLIEFFKGDRYKEKIRALEERVKMLENKVQEMDKFVQSARDLQVSKNMGIDQKKKWLRGYPDETKEKKKEV